MDIIEVLTSVDERGNGSDWLGLDTGEFYESHPAVAISYVAFMGLSAFTAICGNILVIGAVCAYRRLQTKANIFILNLAVADLIIGAVVQGFTIVAWTSGYQFFRDRFALCRFVATVCVVACCASLWSVAAISLNRYICLCKNRYYHVIYTWRRTLLMVCAVWAIATALMLPNYFNWGGHTFDEKVVACVFDRSANYSYTVFLVTLSSAPPIGCIVVCYVRIYRHVTASRRSLRDFGALTHTVRRAASRKQEIRLAKSLFVIFAVFVVCWSPLAVIFLVDIHDRFPRTAYVVATQLAHASSAVNSVVYAATNNVFRDGYQHFLCYCCWTHARRYRRKSASWTSPSRPRVVSSSSGGSSKAPLDEDDDKASPHEQSPVELVPHRRGESASQPQICLAVFSNNTGI